MKYEAKLAELRPRQRGRDVFRGIGSGLGLLLAGLTILCLCAGGQENTTEYWMDQADQLMLTGKMGDVVSALDSALRIDPGNVTILMRKASFQDSMGRLNESAQSYQQALIILEEQLKKSPDDAPAWQKKAVVLRSLNRLDSSLQANEKALQLFQVRIDENESDADAWFGKADALRGLGRWEEARQAYDRVTEIKAGDYEAWLRKAEVFGRIGYINESLQAFDRSLELVSAHQTKERAYVLSSKAEILSYAADRQEEALIALDEVLDINPKARQERFFKGYILHELGREEESLATFGEAIKQDPDDVDAWGHMASQLDVMKRYSESLKAYDTVIELTEENQTQDLAKAWMSKAAALNKTGRQEESQDAWKRALELCEEAIGEDPDDQYLVLSKAETLFNLGRYEDALGIYDRLIETSPIIEPYIIWTLAQSGRGDLLRALGRDQEALDAYNRAIETNPHSGSSWHGRGEAQRALGQNFNASMSLRVAEKLGYEG